MALEGCYLFFVGKYPGYTHKTLTSRAKTVRAKVLNDFTKDLINGVGADNVYLLVPGGSSIEGQQKYLLAKKLGTHVLDTEWLLDCQKQKKRLDTAGYLYQEAQTAAPNTEPHENDEEGGELETFTADNNDQILENDGDDGGYVDGDLEEEVDDWENSRRMTKQDKKRQRKKENIQQQEERKREQTREKGEAKDYEKNNKKRRGQEEGEKEQGEKQRDADEETGKNKADREQTRDRSMTLVAEDTGSDVEDPQRGSKRQVGKSRKSDNQGSVSTKKDANRHNGLSKVKPIPVSADDSEDHSDGGDQSEDADDQYDDDEQIGNDQSDDGDDGLDMIKDEDSQSDNDNGMDYDEDANSSQDEYDARARSGSAGRPYSSP
ncbi:hypothetical protein COL940_006728 [Colletotrichum noveboracense]|nr:hypothetical protein COL940_006728 [Colletotrichum noveboracense]